MADLFANMPPYLGTVSSWVIALSTSGSFGLILNFWINNRKARTDLIQVEGDLEDKLQGHFSNELKRLTDLATLAEERARKAVDDIENAKDRQRECEQREEKLRLRVRRLEDKLTGIVRSMAVEGSLRVLDLTEQPSDEIILAAISSLEHILALRKKPPEESPQ